MPVVEVPRVLGPRDRIALLDSLERIGSSNLAEDLRKTILDVLEPNLLSDKEFLARYFLLAAVLDQQAESGSARQTAKRIFKSYGREFFVEPYKYLDRIHEVLQLALSTYSPKVRVLRIKKEGISLLRVGGFLLAIHSLTRRFGSLIEYFRRFQNPYTLLNKGVLGEPLLSGLLYEKAARLYVGWITHPQLFVRIYGDAIPKSSIPMVVNGHVTKVLARTGFLNSVSVESKDTMIVEAERERARIEREVRSITQGKDLFSIDYGAFLVGIRYCHEERPDCAQCPLNSVCLKNVAFRAY